MKILSLDPSSTITGYAIMETAGDADPRMIEIGKLRKPGEHPPADRIDAMIDALADLLDEHKPDVVLMEVTSGKTSARHKGSGAGLAIYGQAVGEFRRYLLCVREQCGFDLRCIMENDWTRGTSKASRQAVIHAAYGCMYDLFVNDAGLSWHKESQITNQEDER
jgi:hypothetical protein